jgi:hypothetical protein
MVEASDADGISNSVHMKPMPCTCVLVQKCGIDAEIVILLSAVLGQDYASGIAIVVVLHD